MKKAGFVIVVLCLVGTGLLAPEYSEAGLAGDIYLVPVVARNPGAAGSDWRTELCLTNPQGSTLTVGIVLLQGGIAGSGSLPIPPGGTICSEDFILEWFSATKWQGGMIIGATEDTNPGLESRQFLASVRVYNLTANGTYGLSVLPEPLIAEYGNIVSMLDVNAMTGLHHWGTAGVNGSRTSVGLANFGSSPFDVVLGVGDETGETVWQKSIEIEGYSQAQYGLPKNLTLINGFAAMGADDASLSVQAYVTVTDNETGDGRYISGTIPWAPRTKNGNTREGGSPWDLLRDACSFPVIDINRN